MTPRIKVFLGEALMVVGCLAAGTQLITSNQITLIGILGMSALGVGMFILNSTIDPYLPME